MGCDKLNDSVKEDALYGMGFLGVVATLVCLVAASLVFIFKLYKYFSHRLALYQVMAALVLGASLSLELVFLTDPDEVGPLCEIIGFSIFYSSWVKLMFTSWIVLHLLCLSIFYKNLQHLEVMFVLVSILFPLLFAWVPFIPDGYGVPGYGSSGAWCWIRNWRNDYIDDKFTLGIGEQLGLCYVPMMTISAVDSIGIIVIISHLVCCQPVNDEISLLGSGQRMKALKELLPLLVYPIVYCILLIPPLVNRIYGAVARNLNDYMIVISGSFVPIQPLCAGLALLVHVCVLKCSKCIQLLRKRRHSRCRHVQNFVAEEPSTWNRFTGGRLSTKNNMTEACIPNESEVDRLILNQSN